MNAPSPASAIGQLVFARLDRNQSPRRREGFQTAYTSPGYLGPKDLEAIEERLAFFPSLERRQKRLFFTAPSGLVVVARIVATEDRDASGRGGCYVAHALLIRPALFDSVDANPFVFLDNVPFFESLAGALAAGDMATGSIPPLPWQASEAPFTESLPIAEETRRVAASFPFRPPNPRVERPRSPDARVADPSDRNQLSGPEQEIAATLRAVWPLLPAAWRPDCSFDTDFEGCNPAATRYWATGQRAAVKGPSVRPSSSAPSPTSPYGSWVRWRLHDASSPWTQSLRDQAADYCQSLSNLIDPQADARVHDRSEPRYDSRSDSRSEARSETRSGTHSDHDAAFNETLIGEIVSANRSLVRLLLMRGLRDTLRRRGIPSARQRWHWRLRGLLRRLTPRVMQSLLDFLIRKSKRIESPSVEADVPDEFAGDVLAPLWTHVVDRLMASEAPVALYRLAGGQDGGSTQSVRSERATGRAAIPSWPVERITASLRAVARHGGLPRRREIRETISRCLFLCGDRWLLVWYCGWSHGVVGGPLVGGWRRFRLRKLLSYLSGSEQREVVEALCREDALGGGWLLDPDDASELRDWLRESLRG
jgi:hypothetical protein